MTSKETITPKIVETFYANSPRLAPPGTEKLRREIGRKMQAVIFLPKGTAPDAIGETLATTNYAFRNKERDTARTSPPVIIIAGNNNQITKIDTWPELRNSGVVTLADDWIETLDLSRLEQDFGLKPGLKDPAMMAALIAGSLFSGTREQSLFQPTPIQNDHPLLWLQWGKNQTRGEATFPLATTLADPDSNMQRGLLYQANTFRPYGRAAQEVADTIGDNFWIPYSNILTLPTVLQQVPISDSIQLGHLVVSLSVAEITRRNGQHLHKVLFFDRSNDDMVFDPNEELTRKLGIALEILQTQLYIRGKYGIRLTEAKPPDFKRINQRLSQSEGQIIPPVEYLIREGYLDMERINYSPKHGME
jgi:hypothetical protein